MTTYLITRDGQPIVETDDPMAWFHRNHSYSMAHAITHEGYAVEPQQGGYPRKTDDDRTIWACCVASIGPVCEHRLALTETQIALPGMRIAAYAVTVDGVLAGHVRYGTPSGRVDHGDHMDNHGPWTYSPGESGRAWISGYASREAAARRLVEVFG